MINCSPFLSVKKENKRERERKKFNVFFSVEKASPSVSSLFSHVLNLLLETASSVWVLS